MIKSSYVSLLCVVALVAAGETPAKAIKLFRELGYVEPISPRMMCQLNIVGGVCHGVCSTCPRAPRRPISKKSVLKTQNNSLLKLSRSAHRLIQEQLS